MTKTRDEKEHRRNQAIEAAVMAADKIILNCSDGSVEETNFLTAEVARKLMEKALLPYSAAITRKDLEGKNNKSMAR